MQSSFGWSFGEFSCRFLPSFELRQTVKVFVSPRSWNIQFETRFDIIVVRRKSRPFYFLRRKCLVISWPSLEVPDLIFEKLFVPKFPCLPEAINFVFFFRLVLNQRAFELGWSPISHFVRNAVESFMSIVCGSGCLVFWQAIRVAFVASVALFSRWFAYSWELLKLIRNVVTNWSSSC